MKNYSIFSQHYDHCCVTEARKKLSNDNMLIEFLVDPHEREKQISYLLINDLVEAHNEVKSISVSTEHW